MQILTSVLLLLTLLLCGVYAGMTVFIQIGVWPAMRRLQPAAYADAFRAMDFYLDRSMPPYKLTLLLVNLLLCIVLGLQHRAAFAMAAGVSFLLSLTALVLTIRKQLPINTRLRGLSADTPDAVLVEIRGHSEKNFMERCVAAVLAFTVLCYGAVFL